MITESWISYLGSIKFSLHNVFSMTGLGLLKQFLGLEIEKYDVGTKVSQSKYDSKLLLKLIMDEFKETKCPFLSGLNLGDFGSSPLVDNLLYRQLVRILLYITHSQLDWAYDVGVVARYMKKHN